MHNRPTDSIGERIEKHTVLDKIQHEPDTTTNSTLISKIHVNGHESARLCRQVLEDEESTPENPTSCKQYLQALQGTHRLKHSEKTSAHLVKHVHLSTVNAMKASNSRTFSRRSQSIPSARVELSHTNSTLSISNPPSNQVQSCLGISAAP